MAQEPGLTDMGTATWWYPAFDLVDRRYDATLLEVEDGPD